MYSVGSGGRGSWVNSSQQAKSFLSFHPSLLVFLGEVNLHMNNPSNTCSQIMGILTVNDLFLHSTQQPTCKSRIDLYFEISTSVIQLWLNASYTSSTSSHHPPTHTIPVLLTSIIHYSHQCPPSHTLSLQNWQTCTHLCSLCLNKIVFPVLILPL